MNEFRVTDEVKVMVFKATFNNISIISWRSVLLMEETGVPWKTTDLPQVTDKLSCNAVRLAWVGLELTTLDYRRIGVTIKEAIGGIVDHHCIHFLIIILEINFYSILFRVIKYIQILFYGIYKTNIYSIKW
jgi:hypothetical protein